MAEEWIPLPPQAVKPAAVGMESNDPKLDTLIGETVCIRAWEWIGDLEKPIGVRFWLHIVKGEQMEKSARRARAYTEGIMRLVRGWSSPGERGAKLEKWPLYTVQRERGDSYGLKDV